MPKDGRGGDYSTLVNASLPTGCPYVCGAVYFNDVKGRYRLKVLFEREHDDASFTFLSTYIMFKKKRRDAVAEQAWLDTLNVEYWVERCPQLTAKRPRIEEEEEDPDDAQRSASPVSPQLTAKRPRIEEEEEDPDDAQRSASPVSPALYITSPPSPPSSSGPTSTGEWFRFLRFLFISLKHTAFCLSLVNSAFRAHYFVMYSYPSVLSPYRAAVKETTKTGWYRRSCTLPS